MTNHDGPIRKTQRSDAIAAAALLCAVAPSQGLAATTPAGTAIVNTATLSFEVGGAQQTEPSNTVTLTTAELLDVAVTADRASVTVGAADTAAVGFVATNNGNGPEDYTIAATSDVAGVSVTRLIVDTDHDGRYDAAIDQALAAGTFLSLAAGQQQRLFVLVDGAQVAASARLSLAATARTGSGAPGTVFSGAGAQGADAVVGNTGATAAASTTLTTSAPLPSLVKSQSVFAADGSSRAVRGAIITYRLVATFPAATRGVAIGDPIPAGTQYVPGSLTLDDRALTDGSDTDSGSADAGGIHVALGDVAGAATHTVQFSVKIQ